MKVDPEFEAFCRGVSGVSDVEQLSGSYCVAVQASDVYPVRRLIQRWMKATNRQFPVSWEVHRSTNPSAYDPMDRAISSMTYIHQPERS